MVQETWKPFKDLDGHQHISLTTFDKRGEPVCNPLWFAHDDDKIYAIAPSDDALIERIRCNAQVEVAACSPEGEIQGEVVEAMALVLPAARAFVAKRALSEKYGMHKRLFDLRCALRGRHAVYLEITPM